MVFWDGSGISWTICKQSAPRCGQITTTTPHHPIFTGRMMFLTPNQQRQSTAGICTESSAPLHHAAALTNKYRMLMMTLSRKSRLLCTGYEARLSADQPSKKEILFEVICPGRKSYLVSDFYTNYRCSVTAAV